MTDQSNPLRIPKGENRLSSNNPFADSEADFPTVPPPSYHQSANPPPTNSTFYVNLQTALPPAYPIKRNHNRYESSTLYCRQQKRYQTRRIICFLVSTTVLLIIALTIFGAVFHWGKGSSFCVRWNDGKTSGDCPAN